MFSKKIEKYCKENGLSIMAFEVKCGLSNGLVGKWRESGGYPSVPTVQKIAEATGRSIEYWLSNQQENEVV